VQQSSVTPERRETNGLSPYSCLISPVRVSSGCRAGRGIPRRARWLEVPGQSTGGEKFTERTWEPAAAPPQVFSRELISTCVCAETTQSQGKNCPKGSHCHGCTRQRVVSVTSSHTGKTLGSWNSGKSTQEGLASGVSYSSPRTDDCSNPT